MKKVGSLEVVCGPMFSGKSEELIRRLRRAQIARQNVAVFKHALDDRHSIEQVTSHNGSTIAAYPIDIPHKMMDLISANEYEIVGIDEVQFFSHDIILALSQLIDRGVRVIVAGLDLDFRGIPFGPMPTLLAIADKITKLQSICTVCGHDAHFTQRLVNGKPAQFNDPIVQIGAQESYDARCRSCYIIDKPVNYAARQIAHPREV